VEWGGVLFRSWLLLLLLLPHLEERWGERLGSCPVGGLGLYIRREGQKADQGQKAKC